MGLARRNLQHSDGASVAHQAAFGHGHIRFRAGRILAGRAGSRADIFRGSRDCSGFALFLVSATGRALWIATQLKRGLAMENQASLIQLLGAGGFGLLIGWYVYMINRYRRT